MCSGILPGVVNVPIVLMQEGLLPEVAGQLRWETWISVNRANPFLPPCQSHLFRKPKYSLSIIAVSSARLITWLFLWWCFSPCEAAGTEIVSPLQMCITAVLSMGEPGMYKRQRAAIPPKLTSASPSTPAVTAQQAGI